MKRNFYLSALIVITALVYSLIIPATAARKRAGQSPRGQSSNLVSGRARTEVELPVSAGQDDKAVSGQLLQSERQDPELSRALRDYDLIRLEPRAAAAQIRKTGRLLLRTSSGDFDMELAPNDLRSSDYVAQVIDADGVAHKLAKTPVDTYKGIVHGSNGAQARLTVKEGSIEGAVITEGERYFIQPARSLSKERNEDEFVFYKGSDVTKESGSCGVTLADEVAARETPMVTDGKADVTAEGLTPVVGLSPLKIARIATEADAEYVSALGGAGNANAQITSILNLVDGIYQVEIGVTFQIVFQNTWTDSATDPYSSTVPGTLLGQFRSHWNSNFTNIQRSLAHMWTGKNMDGDTIGIASLGVVCRSPGSAYGVSQRFPTSGTTPITAQTVVLTAHEIGHNFSAFHIDEPEDVPPDIQQPCDNTIMESSVGSGSAFCPFSRSQVIGHANAYASCLLDSAVPAPSPSCAETQISSGNTNGTISTSDCPSPSRGVSYFADRYSFTASAGQQVTIRMTQGSGDLDPYLYLIGPDGYVVTQNDDLPGSNDSLIGGPFTLPLSGRYVVEASSFGRNQTGAYVINHTFTGCTISVTPTSQHFPAAGGSGTISVTPSGSCGSYQFSTYPDTASSWLSTQTAVGSGAQSLGYTVQPNTNAAGRRGFLIVGGTSTSNAFGGLRIPITQSGTGPDCTLTPISFGQTIAGVLSTSDCQSPVRGNGYYTDRYVFNAFSGQQVAITLSSNGSDAFLTLLGPNGVVILTDDDSGGGTNSRIPGGTESLTLGLPGTYTIEVGTFESGQTGTYNLTLTGTAPPATNPLEDRDFFVNQHYRDFLDRDADPAGLSYWTGQLAECGVDPSCISSRRVGVSAAFFVELEFQRTGSFVYRLYKGGLARRPTFQEFNTDRAQVVEGPNVEADKQALALAFVQRAEFVQRYAGQTTANAFVDALIASILQASSVNLAGQRDTLIGRYNAGANLNQSRAFALREAIDSTAFVNGEFNAAFVLMQYFGYLRRDPDQAGYNFWLGIVNNSSLASYRSMVCAFLTSREYQERFSSIVPRSDSECANIN